MCSDAGASDAGADDGGSDAGSMNGCLHDVCTKGGPLDANCDACTMAVCANDAYCCKAAGMWDTTCSTTDVSLYCPNVMCGDAGASDAGADDGGMVSDAGADDGGMAMDGGVAMDGGPSCALTDLVISEVRSRGAAGANDDFVELYNPTAMDVALDTTWIIEARSHSSASYTQRWKGAVGQKVPAHGHFLIVGSAYVQMPAKDADLSSGITDASSVVLKHNANVVDAVCFGFDMATLGVYTMAGSTYVCEGTPLSNLPHDNTTNGSSNSDASLERKPGGMGGNCTDTAMNDMDFAPSVPATPLSAASAPTP